MISIVRILLRSKCSLCLANGFMLFSIELKQRTQLSNLRKPLSLVSPVEWWRVAHRCNLFMCTITLMRKIMPPLLTVLGGCGEVGDIRYPRYSQSASLSTGNRLIQKARQKHLPRSLNDTGYAVKTWYASRPTECDICREAHVAKDCPFRGKCRRCLQMSVAPWITVEFKELIRARDKAFARGDSVNFRRLRNKVNRERKLCRSRYFNTKVAKLKKTKPSQ